MSDLMRAADLNPPSELRVATERRGLDQASSLLTRFFRSFDGSLALRLCNGANLTVGDRDEWPVPLSQGDLYAGCAGRQERGS